MTFEQWKQEHLHSVDFTDARDFTAAIVFCESAWDRATAAEREPMTCGHPKACWRSAEQIASTMTMCTQEATQPDRNIFIVGHCLWCAEIDEWKSKSAAERERHSSELAESYQRCANHIRNNFSLQSKVQEVANEFERWAMEIKP